MPLPTVPRLSGTVVFLALLVSTPVRATPTAPVYRAFGDWVVGCDNAGDCEARGFTDGGDATLALRFTRKAGASAVPELALENAPAGAKPPLTLDGRAWAPPAGSIAAAPGVDADGAPSQVVALRGVRELQALAGAARNAKRIGLASSDRSGSLAGFNAAMLFVDDVQGRVGTPTAVARPGAAKSPVPGARALPVVRLIPARGRPLGESEARRYVRALPLAAFDCADGPGGDSAPDVEPLTTTLVIAMVPCLRGAYQSSPVVFVGPRDDPRRALPVELPYPPGAGEGERGLVTEPSFDPATSTLSMFAKGRGLADCGASGEWAFDGRGFVLLAFSMLDRCGWPAPGDYLTLWRATGVPGVAR